MGRDRLLLLSFLNLDFSIPEYALSPSWHDNNTKAPTRHE